jgi:hypothetical protein
VDATAQGVLSGRADWAVECGNCLEVLPTLPAESFDACICDPPYPEIDREYGRLTESEWWELMMGVCREVRRVLKPSGSAVFVLQPNGRKVGSMRGWLWRFLAWACEEWNVVQDAYWWNTCALTEAHAIQGRLLRASLKTCAWCGPPDCHRDQDAVLAPPSARMERHVRTWKGREDDGRRKFASGQGANFASFSDALEARGGVTPFNVLATGSKSKTDWGVAHPAKTPYLVCDWWTRYLVPPGGAVLDPFAGSGTVGVAALRRGCMFVGIEKESGYVEIARRRLADVDGPLFDAVPPAPSPAPGLFDALAQEAPDA